MPYLLDSGILLRIVDRKDQRHDAVTQSVGILIKCGENLVISTQNVAEFHSVATRPGANNGLGLTPRAALDLLKREIEPVCAIMHEPATLYPELKRLIAKYNVVGKQVHDARLAAMMLVWQIDDILTLNDRDFRRYEPEGLRIVTPETLINTP